MRPDSELDHYLVSLIHSVFACFSESLGGPFGPGSRERSPASPRATPGLRPVGFDPCRGNARYAKYSMYIHLSTADGYVHNSVYI
jgi:hypothetical protein